MKLLRVLSLALLIVSFSLIVTPKPAEAFTLFGIRFFEKAKPTPTPTPSLTPTPEITTTPTPVTDQGNLPSTGPEQAVGPILLIVVGAFVARKYWQISQPV